jgi:hypothetical protein
VVCDFVLAAGETWSALGMTVTDDVGCGTTIRPVWPLLVNSTTAIPMPSVSRPATKTMVQFTGQRLGLLLLPNSTPRRYSGRHYYRPLVGPVKPVWASIRDAAIMCP